MPANRTYRNVVRAALAQPWAIEEPRLAAICELLEARAAGERFNPEQIEARVAAFEGKPPAVDAGDDVAIVPLRGVIVPRANLMTQISGGTSLQKFSARIQAAAADPAIRSIVIAIDSPGGVAIGATEAAAVVRAAREQKPVIAIAYGAMGSAAYWIGSASTKIIASPSSQVGSIGALTVHSERSQADAAAGISRTVFSVGRYKADGNDAEPLTDQARATIQNQVDKVYAMFVGDVAANRSVSLSTIEAKYGQGKSFFAAEALALGMIDEVATYDQAIAAIVGEAPASNDRFFSTKPTAAAAAIPTETVKMNPEIRAALEAAGYVSAAASETEAVTAFNLACKIKGLDPKAPTDQLVAAFRPKSAEDLFTEQRRAEVQAAERTRAKQIRAAGQGLARFGLPEASIEHAIDNGLSAVEASAYFAEQLTKINQPVTPVEPKANGITAGPAERDKVSGAIEEVLTARAMATIQRRDQVKALSPAALEIQHRPAMALAEMSLKSLGVRTEGMTPEQIAKNALKCDNPAMLLAMGPDASYNTTGSLPNVMLNVQNKVKDLAFQEAPVTYPIWCAVLPSVPNFLPQNLINLSGSGNLPVVPEGKEFQQSKSSDKREWFAVETYGDEEGLTFQMLMNDNLDFLSSVPQLKAVAAARTINASAYGSLTSNPTLGEDNLALFDASHNNTIGAGSGGVPSVVQLGKMRAKLASQKGLDAKSRLRLPMAFVLVPVALQTTAEQLMMSPTDPAISNAAVVNPFGPGGANRQQVIADPELDLVSAAQWYGVTDKSIMRTVCVAFLAGQETPRITSWWDEHRNTRWIKVEQTFATLAANFRGVVQNAGS